mmetsp:Transcript_16944/g.25763  ORF Transcript_16944/g.25763 Transcript_16944/m.25763 type:complete len:568 (-) Transcript_16944:108-1811(-)
MATTNQDLKRVISNPEAIMVESDREDKKTRVENMTVAALENHGARQEAEENMEGEGAPDQSGFPFSATMSQDGSRLSSLSGEEGSNSDDDSLHRCNEEEGEEEEAPGDDNGGGGVPLKKEASNRIKRQVSHDESMSNSNSSSQNRQSSITGGNWGWFEDVHGHEPAASGGESLGGGVKGDGKKEQKKSGIWKMGSDLMQSALEAIIEPQKQEHNTMAVTAPTYVLEESLSTQRLWKHTAGNRPPQPVEERAFFEQVWAQNFTRSKVRYEIPVEVLTASTPIAINPFNDDVVGHEQSNISNYNLAAPFNMKGDEDSGMADPASVKAAQADVAEATLNHHLNSVGAIEMYFDPNRPKDYNMGTLGPHKHHHTLVNKKMKGVGSDNDLTVVVRGDNVFGTTVSKSFPAKNDKGQLMDGVDTVSVSIASYRVVESKKHGKYAQYLVIFCDGNFRNTVGVWKRYSDFSQLSRKVSNGPESCAAVVTGLNPLSVTDDDLDVELLPNAMTSWRLLKKRQRWYRCLDAGYLSLKVFLLERFLHDILFESSNPQILRDFVGVKSSEGSKLDIKGLQ